VPVVRSPAPVDVSLGAGDCVAVVGVAWGYQKVESVGIAEVASSPAPMPLSTHELESGLVGHAQWCADAPASVRLSVVVRGTDLYGREGSVQGYLRMAVYRGPGASFGGLRGLTRGTLQERAYRRVPVSALVADANRRAPTGALPLARELTIAPNAASLVPEDAVTYGALYDSARNGTSQAVNPRVSPLPLDVPAAWRPAALPGLVTSITGLRARVTTTTAPAAQFPLSWSAASRGGRSPSSTRRASARRAQSCASCACCSAIARESRAHLQPHDSHAVASGRERGARPTLRRAANGHLRGPADDQETYLLRTYAAP